MEQDGASRGSPSREAPAIDLRSIELFRSVDPATVAPLLRACPIRSLPAGERLIEAGQPNSSLHVILSGRLSVHLAALDGAPLVSLGAGEAAGELSLIDHRPTSASVTATTDARVLTIDAPLLWHLVQNSHQVAVNLLQMLSRRLRHDNDLIRHFPDSLRSWARFPGCPLAAAISGPGSAPCQ